MGFRIYFSPDRAEYYDSDACALFLASSGAIPIVANSKFLFEYLARNRGTVLTRAQIEAKLGHREDPGDLFNHPGYRSPVDQAVKALRGKLGPYRGCIESVRGVGYKYVGPPCQDKQAPAPPTEGPPQAQVPPQAAAPPQAVAPPQAEAHAVPEPVERLHSALNALVLSQDVAEARLANLLLRRAVRRYVDAVSLSFFRDTAHFDPERWMAVSDRHEGWLRRAVQYAEAEVEAREADEELLDLKVGLLESLYEWHILLAFLSARLALEQDALEISGREIVKEERRLRIDSLERDYRLVLSEGASADLALQEKMQEMELGRAMRRTPL